MAGERPAPRREWLTIHEASELIGVSPATLRRWSDAGEIKAFTTPGGHRRFARAAVLGLIPADRRPRASGRLGDIGERVGRIYRRLAAAGSAEGVALAGFLVALAAPDRGPFLELGTGMAVALIELCDRQGRVGDGEDGAIAKAETAAAAFGALAAVRGATVAETVDAFLSLRRPFLHELTTGACRHGLDARETTELMETATEAIDHLLAALVRGHQSGVELPAQHAALANATAPAPAN